MEIKPLIRNLILSALLACAALPSSAANTIESVVTPILEKIHKGEISGLASMALAKESGVREYISQTDIKQLDAELSSYLGIVGNSNGYELYLTNDMPGIYEIRYYLFRFDRQPGIVKFELYKPKEDWRINSISLDFNLDDKMERASEVRLGAMGFPDLREKYKANK